MDRHELNIYNQKLDKYRKLSENEKLNFQIRKLVNPKLKSPYEVKMKISGLHIEISKFENPIWRGIQRDEGSIQAGIEERQKSQLIKEQMHKEIEDFISANPDISVTENPDKIRQLNVIKEKYEEHLKVREDNNRRKVRQLRDKIQSNFHIWTHFITLSFRENITNLELAKNRFKDWSKKMAKIYPEFKYIYVVEFQQRGSIHFHVLGSIRPGKKVSKEMFNQIRKTWEWGENTNGIDIKAIQMKYIPQEDREKAKEQLSILNSSKQVQAVWSIGNYLTSYLKKDANSVLLFGSKMYGGSKGLKSAIEISDPKKIAQIKRELGLDLLKEKTYEIGIPETGNKVIKSFYNLLMKKEIDDQNIKENKKLSNE